MNKLTEILNDFWHWSGITEGDYKNGNAINIDLKGEWEDNFPKWNTIEIEIKNAVNDLNIQMDENLLDNIVTIISLDIENGIIMDYCLDHLLEKDLLLEKCAKSELVYARFEVASRIDTISIPPATIKSLMNDENDLVRKTVEEIINKNT
jgi:hypothetical protein